MAMHISTHNKNLKHIFKWPIVIGVFTLWGLIVALIEEGGSLEYLAILALAIPVIIMIYFYWIHQS